MEGGMCEGEHLDPRQPHQRAETNLEASVQCNSSFQVHHDPERAELQRCGASMECGSGQGQAILERSSHHMPNKEDDTKVRKRQKTFSAPQTQTIPNTSFLRRPSVQELPSSVFGHNFQGSTLDPRTANHHDMVRLPRNMDYGSIHPGALTLHSSPPLPAQQEFSLDCSSQDGPKSTLCNNASSQGSRATRVQVDQNGSAQGYRSIGLHTDHSNSIQGSRTSGVQAEHSSVQESRSSGLQATHSNIQGMRKYGLQADHSSTAHASRLTGPQANHSSCSSSAQGCRATGIQADRCCLLPGSRVTGLYAELVKELESQVSELRKVLSSRDEVFTQQEQRIKHLEQENQQLKCQMRTLEEQNDLLSSRNEEAARADQARMLLGPGNGCVDVTESNIQFLKGLVGFLESNAGSQVNIRVPLPPRVPAAEPKMPPAEVRVPPFMQQAPRVEPKTPPVEVREPSPVGMLRVSGVTGGFQYWMNAEESSDSPAALNDSCAIWEETIQETLPDGTPVWASPVEENGRPKLELIPNSGVYITHHQLDDLSQISNEKPKLMTRRLLDYFFSRETLARSSATGQRIAHNNTTMEKPIRLPVAVVSAIKEYVTNVCGRGCNFNAVINSKCGTSRRAVKKMSIRIDWMEGGGQHCPRTEVIAEGSLSPCGSGTATLQNSGSYQRSAMSMDDPAYS
ncbi:uncharacterized protein [Ambystoma mexicanum]|uniref:uncharacterized protein isoform X1 n=1 Tax=Ambystoma mexicanum TaxID=8296 RepID=UPI0037E88ACA